MKRTRRKNLFDNFDEQLDLGALPRWGGAVILLTGAIIMFFISGN